MKTEGAPPFKVLYTMHIMYLTVSVCIASDTHTGDIRRVIRSAGSCDKIT